MIHPELRHIESPQLEPPNLPEDPFDCEVLFRAVVGPKDGEGAETFVFSVITPTRLAQIPDPMWGKGRLIVTRFDWAPVVRAVAELLVECAAPTWNEVVAQLDLSLRWVPDQGETDA